MEKMLSHKIKNLIFNRARKEQLTAEKIKKKQFLHTKSNGNWKRGRESYVEEEGPKRGFCERGWKEKRERKRATHFSSPLICLGQLLKYMRTTNMATLTRTNTGISHEIQLLSLSSTRYEVSAAEAFPSSMSCALILSLFQLPLFLSLSLY